jgi:ABC-type transporter Mla maintaining outer membrane lipid asymmetry ATPase subunit MlaF
MTNQNGGSGIAASDVCKSFGDHLVLDKVNLEVEEGTIVSLLGPNGAGKTTMVRILSTLIPADWGSMYVAGHDVVGDPDGVRSVIGVTTSAARQVGGGSSSCWSASSSPTPPTSRCRSTRAGCDAGSTWR